MVASIGQISAKGIMPAVIEARVVASLGRIGATGTVEMVDQVEALAQQLLAAAEANPAITFASRDQALAYYRTAARSELARKARAEREEREWQEQVEMLRWRSEQAQRPWEGLGVAA